MIKKTIRAFLAFITLCGLLCSPSYGREEYIGGVCVEKDGQWLATEGGDGRLTTIKNLQEGRYSNYYREGLLCAKPEGKQSKWGYVNEKGSFIIAPQFDWAEGFKNGVAKVKRNGTWGIVNAKGEFKENNSNADKLGKKNISQEASALMMKKHMLATKIKIVGNNLRVLVNFQHERAVRVIHDEELVSLAKQVGLKRLEFHDWSGFSKDTIYINIK